MLAPTPCSWSARYAAPLARSSRHRRGTKRVVARRWIWLAIAARDRRRGVLDGRRRPPARRQPRRLRAGRRSPRRSASRSRTTRCGSCAGSSTCAARTCRVPVGVERARVRRRAVAVDHSRRSSASSSRATCCASCTTCPRPQTAPIVVAERVTRSDRAARARGRSASRPTASDPTLVIVAGALIALGLVLLAWPRPTRALIDLVTRPRRLRRLRAPLHETLRRARRRCAGRGRSRVATLIAVPAWGCECVGFALICNAFPGAHVDLGLAMVIYAGDHDRRRAVVPARWARCHRGRDDARAGRGAASSTASTALAATLLTRLATLWFAVAARRRCSSRSRAGASHAIAGPSAT